MQQIRTPTLEGINSSRKERYIKQQILIASTASIWFEIWGVVDPGQKISIF